MKANPRGSAGKGLVSAQRLPSIGFVTLPLPVGLAGSTGKRAPIFRLASLERSRDILAVSHDQLTFSEKARSGRYVRQQDRERFALGRLVLRSMLADFHGIEPLVDLDIDEFGKPSLHDRPEIGFNIAHSGDLVLVGMGSDLQLGVDVEMHRPEIDIAAISELIFAPSERPPIFGETDRQAVPHFFGQWCRKEALVKALGTGLAYDPRRFAINPEKRTEAVTFVGDGPDDVGKGWRSVTFDIGSNYSAAAAWRDADR